MLSHCCKLYIKIIHRNPLNDINGQSLISNRMSDKYTVYRNDIKNKKKNQIDPADVEWDGCTEKDFEQDTDQIDYRISECVREKYDMLDLSNMSDRCFSDLIEHVEYKSIQMKLKHLFMSNSHLKNIPSLVDFVNLETLDLNNNLIDRLPVLPESLQELNIENNRLKHINQMFPNMKRLFCKNNLLENLVIASSMERIECSHNPLRTLRSFDGKYGGIYYMDCSNTLITEIPPMERLRQLDCSNTPLTKLPRIDSLKVLSSNDSGLEDITLLNSLESIAMVRNNINSLHYFASLQEITFEKSRNIMFSKKYRVKCLQENRNEIYKVIFE